PLLLRRHRCSAEPVRALRHGFSTHLDRPAEDLDRAAVVQALDSLSRPRKEKGKGKSSIRHGTAIAGRTAAYGRACFAWAMKRGTLPSNPFAELPMVSPVTKRERVLSDEEAGAIWRAAGERPPPPSSPAPSTTPPRPPPPAPARGRWRTRRPATSCPPARHSPR